MEQFAAKKLGEVLAFARVGVETIERARTALDKTFGQPTVNGLLKANRDHAQKLEELAAEENVADITLPKAEKTSEKLRAMRELYLKENDWDDPAEIMEWLGFFEGAAIVHWQLVQGAVESAGNNKLLKLAEEGAELHGGALRQIGEAIKSLAAERVAAK